jgi:hypothetical protein
MDKVHKYGAMYQAITKIRQKHGICSTNRTLTGYKSENEE